MNPKLVLIFHEYPDSSPASDVEIPLRLGKEMALSRAIEATFDPVTLSDDRPS